MSTPKIAFCFTGQGSLEAGMGKEIAPRRAGGDGGLRARVARPRASTSCALCFEAPEEELVHTEVQQPALVATSLAVLAALRESASSRTWSSATPSASSPRLPPRQALSNDDAIRLVRARGLAMAEAARENPGSMAAILGLADEVV